MDKNPLSIFFSLDKPEEASEDVQMDTNKRKLVDIDDISKFIAHKMEDEERHVRVTFFQLY